MLLLVDAGNTRVKWALAGMPGDDACIGHWQAYGALFHAELDGLEQAWRGLPIERVIVSNVAGSNMRSRIEHALGVAQSGTRIQIEWFASVPEAGGVRNGYRNPSQLGCDRFATAIGAHALHPGKALVVATCGTATTVDAISPEGEFTGGMILPGLGLMATSLARNTAQLPQIGAQLQVDRMFADNTDDAIVSGCLAAQAGAIERAVTVFSRQYPDVHCLLSGGAGAMIAPHLSISCSSVDNLVLIGLHTFALRERLC